MIPLRTSNGIAFAIPTSWPEVTLGDFLHWVQRGTWPLPCEVDALDARSIVALGTALSFLQELPDWEKPPYFTADVSKSCYGKKVDALHYYGQHSNDLHGAALPILAIYAMKDEHYDHDYAIGKVMPGYAGTKAVETYPRFLSIIRQLEAVEAELSASLKDVPYDPPEIKAAFEPLKAWGAYGVVDSLAGGNMLRMDEIFQMSVAEVHTKIRYDNAKAYCQWKAGQMIKAKNK